MTILLIATRNAHKVGGNPPDFGKRRLLSDIERFPRRAGGN